MTAAATEGFAFQRVVPLLFVGLGKAELAGLHSIKHSSLNDGRVMVGDDVHVPIPHWLAEEFRTYCSRLYGLTPDDRVFYMTCTALNKELTRCTQITYLPDIRVHDLRHSHVSLCIELGYSIVLVAKRIGDTVPVVMRTYAHLYPNKQQELVSRLETLSTSSSSKDESDLMPLV